MDWMAWLYWDPPQEAFTIPILGRPVLWYGILFVIGFIVSYLIVHPILTRFLQQQFPSQEKLQHTFGPSFTSPKQAAYFLTDRLCWFVVAGTIIGARLGAVFFYDWPQFRQQPLDILKVWHGGLASHGGVLGIMIALYLYVWSIHRWLPQLTFLHLLDYLAVPSGLAACFIRLGNFINQEILGTPTTLPWGVIFGHPADSSLPIPRHPVQLYEAIAYLSTFLILGKAWKSQKFEKHPGALAGLLFILIFGSRFILEFWKTTQESIPLSSSLHMGQLLSLPFILLGTVLFWHSTHRLNPQETP